MSFIFAFIAGLLSTLSPCVLPILPIIVSSALQNKIKGLIALVFGLSLAFAVMGTFISYSAMIWGFDTNIIKMISAGLLLFFGLVLIIDKLNLKFVEWSSKLTNKGNEKIATYEANGVKGQFVLGLLLGMVWIPCVGPTLGAAIGLAMNGDSLLTAFSTMIFFGFGAGLPLLLIGFASTKFKDKQKISSKASKSKKILGFMLILISVLILTGFDKQLEILLLDLTPEWLNNLTTKF